MPLIMVDTGFICRSTKVQSRTVFGSMKPNWLLCSFIKSSKKWLFLAKKGSKLHNNFTSGMSLNFLVIRFCASNRRLRFQFDSCQQRKEELQFRFVSSKQLSNQRNSQKPRSFLPRNLLKNTTEAAMV